MVTANEVKNPREIFYGPVTLQATKGGLNYFEETLQISEEYQEVILHLTNGSTAKNRAVFGTITLNGTEIVDTKRFNNRQAELAIPITLKEGTNKLAVKYFGGSKAFVKLTLDGTPLVAVKMAVSPQTGYAPLKVDFSANATPVTKEVVKYQWDFDNDGTIDAETNTPQVSHTYEATGSYTAKVIVIYRSGAQAEYLVHSITAESVFDIDATAYPLQGEAPLKVLFNTSATSKAGTVNSFRWDYDNDGRIDWSTQVVGTNACTYETAGTYQATLKVGDDKGNTAEKVFTIKVLPGKPTVNYTVAPTNGGAPLTVNFQAKATIPGSSVSKYEWDFDGTGSFDWSSAGDNTASILAQDAEAGLGEWIGEGSWAVTDRVGNGTSQKSFTDSPDGYYDRSHSNTALISPEIDLTNALNPYLEFYHKYQTERYYDFAYVEVSKNGSSYWRREASFHGSQRDWDYKKIDLNSYVGQKIRIRFRIYVSGSGGDYDGWYLDDIKVKADNFCTHTYTKVGEYQPLLRITAEDGQTFDYQASKVTVGETGTPTVTINASQAQGIAPLKVDFAALTDGGNGQITKYEWDFDGDGTFDSTSPTSGAASYTYTQPGTYPARVRVTNQAGLASEASVQILADLAITLKPLPEKFNPEKGETFKIDYALNGTANVSLDIIKKDSTVIRNLLVNEAKDAGDHTIVWDGRDNQGKLLPQDIYYVIIKGKITDGREFVLDLTNEVTNLSNPRLSFPAYFNPFQNQFCRINWYMPQKGLATIYVGYSYGNRVRTLRSKVPYQKGNHQIFWDGTDDTGALCLRNGTKYFIGIFAESISQNGIVLDVNEPEIKQITVEPNYYNAEYNAYQATPGRNQAQFEIVFNIPSQVVITIKDSQGVIVRSIKEEALKTNQTVTWDGQNNNGQNVAAGIYAVEIQGISPEGYQSKRERIPLVVFY